jgi:ethanolamine ammonia-lyase small subunit
MTCTRHVCSARATSHFCGDATIVERAVESSVKAVRQTSHWCCQRTLAAARLHSGRARAASAAFQRLLAVRITHGLQQDLRLPLRALLLKPPQ